MISGIHHITCVTRDGEKNMRFYTRVLGLRLVKRTVNFDDPSAYHLYYGDAKGTPGTVVTFFYWENIPEGTHGLGQASCIALSVPQGSLPFWQDHLKKEGVSFEKERRFGKDTLVFFDPDGVSLELVEGEKPVESVFWEGGSIPRESAIQGIRGVTLAEEEGTDTFDFFHEVLQFPFEKQEANIHRYAGGEGTSQFVDVATTPDHFPGTMGSGAIHHVAFRVREEHEQEEWRAKLERYQVDVTPLIDRFYFRSIYFPEPGGILFEIATEGPGFLIDEPFESLGESFTLPPWLLGQRERVENNLPELPSFE